ncbi:AAA family ATPase [Sulfurimonas lithotrophica]|uniref:DNA repair protein RecN n=1 Tax=Sulfurimonas lithotrophica TaxID=2590022 RepID=A0A5P8P0Y0_9BACT|nr:AAA family ATPase [Sulfurimonas lithotrophica]QFR49270.1 AAA family ATPase [Sulfurimonas lithotrophica]
MIERFFLKDYLSFKEVELNLSSGLIVFTGPSGSGKSILINSILSSLGNSNCEASVCESSTSWEFDGNEYGLECDDINVFKHIKKEKSRYFINNQSVSKKSIQNISAKHLRYLSLKDYSDFENENLLNILDARIEKKLKNIFLLKDKYKKTFLKHKELFLELKNIEDEEKRIVELKEFAKFEIEKIESINPSENEDVELLEIKKELSKKEKVLESLSYANEIFNNEHNVFNALDALEIDSAFFSDAMNELRATLDGAEEKFSALEEVDVEEVLNRLEELSEIKRRYGSIKEALEYKENKKIELQKYENIEVTKDELQKKVEQLNIQSDDLAEKLTKLRTDELSLFEKDLNSYLNELYLDNCNVFIKNIDRNELGKDEISISLNGAGLDKISTGEFNRLRLAILALKTENMNKNGGVLMLDEIDANLSGEESMSVAKVLKKLSKYFQVFVISHQPQLTSMGDQHFLVHKENGESKVTRLDFENRIDEIARIISGDKISDEAKKFARELLEG